MSLGTPSLKPLGVEPSAAEQRAVAQGAPVQVETTMEVGQNQVSAQEGRAASGGLVFPAKLPPDGWGFYLDQAERILAAPEGLGNRELREASVGIAALLSGQNPSKEGANAKLADALCVCITEGKFTHAERRALYEHAGPAAAGTRIWSSGAMISAPAIEGMVAKTLSGDLALEPGRDPKPVQGRVEVVQKALDRLSYFVGREKTPPRGREAAWEALSTIRTGVGAVPTLEGRIRLPEVTPLAQDVARFDAPRRESLLEGKNREEANKVILGKLADLLVAGDVGTIRQAWAQTARFHKYSLYNRLMIAVQDPDATAVGSWAAWKKNGYAVKEDQRKLGIEIWVPTFGKPKETQSEGDEPAEGREPKDAPKQLKGFILGRVYDVRQVEAIPGAEQKDIYGFNSPAVLKAGGDQEALDLVITALRAEGIQVAFKDNLDTLDPLHHGTSFGGMVEALDNLPLAEKIRVLVHEWAHEVLHQREEEVPHPSNPDLPSVRMRRGQTMTRSEKELEADSTACVVLGHLGVDGAEATWAYLKGYGINRERLEAAIPSIMKAADEIRGKLAMAEQKRTEAEAREDEAEVESMEASISEVKAEMRAKMVQDPHIYVAQVARFNDALERFGMNVDGGKARRASAHSMSIAMLDAVYDSKTTGTDLAEDAKLVSALHMERFGARVAEVAGEKNAEKRLAVMVEMLDEQLHEDAIALNEETFDGLQEVTDLLGQARSGRDVSAVGSKLEAAEQHLSKMTRVYDAKISAIEKQVFWLSTLAPGADSIGAAEVAAKTARERYGALYRQVLDLRIQVNGEMDAKGAELLAGALLPVDGLGRWFPRDWDGNRAEGDTYVSDGAVMIKRSLVDPKATKGVIERVNKTSANRLKEENMERVWTERKALLEGALPGRILGVIGDGEGFDFVTRPFVMIGSASPTDQPFKEVYLSPAYYRTLKFAVGFDGILVAKNQSTIGFTKGGELAAVAVPILGDGIANRYGVTLNKTVAEFMSERA